MERMTKRQWDAWKRMATRPSNEVANIRTMSALPKGVRDAINAARNRLGKAPI